MISQLRHSSGRQERMFIIHIYKQANLCFGNILKTILRERKSSSSRVNWMYKGHYYHQRSLSLKKQSTYVTIMRLF